MLDFVLWTFAIVLTPTVLGLAWKLIWDIGRLIDLGIIRIQEAMTGQQGMPELRDLDSSSHPGPASHIARC
jgi:hypothetical protein